MNANIVLAAGGIEYQGERYTKYNQERILIGVFAIGSCACLGFRHP